MANKSKAQSPRSKAAIEQSIIEASNMGFPLMPSTVIQWRTDLPDADITVVIRLKNEEWPIVLGWYDADGWCDSNTDSSINCEVIGWMHLHEAVAILDAIPQSAIRNPQSGKGES